ncbi:OmpP1/FadL family transporter [Hymenobacter sp. DG25A]|uniref:OmpP1/FadL family transporter n=1 Tax=Hymenobacter sp. DG25A TaxID=1385663 RepID=UPI0006BDAFCF|nr:hypothetical protein [Hymenobacter sp. DG25A]ALD22126.1 hypothetical protein AM218_14060 [Hymenobacter sp. DG25A]
MSSKKFAGFVGLVVLSALAAPRSQGQGLGNSPYSRLGLGDEVPNTGGIRQQGMGGAGLAAPNGSHVNDQNPAMLFYTTRTTFELGLNGQYKTVKNNVASQKDGSATLGYMVLAVPLSSRWAASLGLRPYSVVDFEAKTIDKVEGDPNARSLKQYEGTGSLSQAYIAQGVKVAKGLTVGVTASYIFGAIDQKTKATLLTDTSSISASTTTAVVGEHTYYSDFNFRVGSHYRTALNSNLNLNVGGTYTFGSKLDGTNSVVLDRERIDGTLLERTPVQNDQTGAATLPSTIQGGISFDNNKNWTVAADASQTKWSDYRGFRGTNTTPLDNTFRVAAGGELTPDPTSVDSYFKRVTYRVGLSVASMPYRPAGQTLYDRSVSWGFTLPVPSATALDAAAVNLSFTYGMRGNTDVSTAFPKGNIQEDYVRAQLGFTLNNRWFIKRRVE